MSDTEPMKPVRCGCGGEAVLNTGKIIAATGEHLANVKCKKCGIAIPVKVSLDQSEAEAEAITAWNKAMGTDARTMVQVFVHDAMEMEKTAKVKHNGDYFECSECGEGVALTQFGKDRYCSHCGARLEWGE